jgi:hypothetical protein
MLRLWADTLFSRDVSSVVKVADLLHLRDVSTSKSRLRDPDRTRRRGSPTLITWLVPFLEDGLAQLILRDSARPFALSDAFLLATSTSFLSFVLPPRSKAPTLALWSSQFFQLPYYGAHLLGLPPGLTRVVHAALLACHQVRRISEDTGVLRLSALGFIETAAAALGSHLLRRQFGAWVLARTNPYIAVALIGVVEALMVDFIPFIAELGIGHVLERIADTFLFFESPALPHQALPITEEAPQSLQCSICHELVADPMMLFGFLFCRSCLLSWMGAGEDWIHPVTGEPFCAVDIEPSGIYRCLAAKYYQAVTQRNDE